MGSGLVVAHASGTIVRSRKLFLQAQRVARDVWWQADKMAKRSRRQWQVAERPLAWAGAGKSRAKSMAETSWYWVAAVWSGTGSQAEDREPLARIMLSECCSLVGAARGSTMQVMAESAAHPGKAARWYSPDWAWQAGAGNTSLARNVWMACRAWRSIGTW